MRNDAVFAARVARINKSARRKQHVKSRPVTSLGERLVTPLMLMLSVGGGITATWEVMERPTDTPLELAGTLTAQLISYLGAV